MFFASSCMTAPSADRCVCTWRCACLFPTPHLTAVHFQRWWRLQLCASPPSSPLRLQSWRQARPLGACFPLTFACRAQLFGSSQPCSTDSSSFILLHPPPTASPLPSLPRTATSYSLSEEGIESSLCRYFIFCHFLTISCYFFFVTKHHQQVNISRLSKIDGW